MRLGAALPIAGDRAIDQPGIERRERGIIQPEAGHHAGAEILDHDVEAGHHLLDEVADRRGLEVAGQRLLAGVEVAEIGAVPIAQGRAGAHLIALERLDLDHLGAQIGQHARGKGPAITLVKSSTRTPDKRIAEAPAGSGLGGS
jgi:hypothetical protein